MKTKLLTAILIAIFVFTGTGFSAPVSFEQAELVAQNAVKSAKLNLKHKKFNKQSALRSGGLMIAPAVSENPLLYVFQNDVDKGFVIVSGDDVFKPIIGISENGTYDSLNLPLNFAWYLDNIEREMAFALEVGQTQSFETANEWRNFVSGAKFSYEEGTYLITTEWSQGEPYYNKTPVKNSQQTLTGCVATAMAQIINYHKYPAKTMCEIPEYITSTDKILVPALPFVIFDWDNMANIYPGTTAQNNAVATLMDAVGRSVVMDYGVSASGAYSWSVDDALLSYFAYDYGIQHINRSSFSDDDWENTLKEQIDLSLPVYYSGVDNSSGGHAFVLDGYDDSGNFHFNWGWGGYCDGWFVLTALNPHTYNYDAAHSAVINIMPRYDSPEVSNLINAAANGGMYKLDTDIDGIDKFIGQLNVIQDFTLDLNGYKLTIEIPHGKNSGIKIAKDKTFTIMDSRLDGVLNVNNFSTNGSAISATYGTLIVESGIINAVGGKGSAGIGGNYGEASGTIIINNGIVNAIGGEMSAGIGSGGRGCTGGEITINGGVVNAIGGNYGGIGIGNSWSKNDDGTFTLNGNSVVFTNSISDTALSRKTNGILFVGNTGTFYGTNVTPTLDFTIPAGKALVIPDSATLIILDGITMTNNGVITNCGEIVGKISGNLPERHKLGNFSDWDTTKFATCIESGNRERIGNCAICSQSENETEEILQLTGEECDITPIIPDANYNGKYGIKFVQNIVSDKAEISIVLPNDEIVAETKIVVYDITGNIVFNSVSDLSAKVSKGRPHTAGAGSRATTSPFGLIWNLKNTSGRNVANGTYLVIAEAKNINGDVYHYSSKLGVKR